MKKKNDNEQRKTKPKLLIGCAGIVGIFIVLFFISAFIAAIIEMSKDEKPEKTVQVSLNEKSETKELGEKDELWKNTINEIKELDIPLDRKQHEATMKAIDYVPSEKEISSFYNEMMVEYESGNYLRNPKDESFIIENSFKSYVVHTHSKDTNISDIAYYYWKNVRLVYNKEELVDSSEIQKNELKIKERLPASSKSRDITISETTWKQELDSIINKDINKNNKEVQVSRLAREFNPSSKELNIFFNDIITNYENKEYLNALENEEESLKIIFKSYVLYKHSSNQIINEIGYDYYQITRDVYRGYEKNNGEFVTANIHQIERSIQKLKSS